MPKMHPEARMARCYSKVRYSSFGLAETAASRLKEQERHPFNVYHCDLCAGFHVGNPLRRWKKPDRLKRGALTQQVNNWRDPEREGEPLTEEEIITRARAHNALRLARRQSNSGKQQCEVIVCGRLSGGPHPCGQRAMRERTIDGHRVCSFHGIEHPEWAAFTNEDAIALHRSRKRVQSRLEIEQGEYA